jgi:hypothetical protein
MIFVSNPLDRPVVIRSFCGDSVQIPAKTRGVQVADKFGWQVPAGLLVEEGEKDSVDPTAIVKGEEQSGEMIRPPADPEAAKALEAKLGNK